jgi:deazaflavin-dependent oxidoreductase (nitroreductase family)
MSRYADTMKRIAKSRAGGWYFVNVAGRIDPAIMRATKGRVTLSPGFPILLLRTIGAKSGEPRDIALLYASDGDRIVLIASKAGSSKNPAWYHNLMAHPEIDVLAPGRTGRYVAREVTEDPERERLWKIATELYPGYDAYQTRTDGRRIPVIALERRA